MGDSSTSQGRHGLVLQPLSRSVSSQEVAKEILRLLKSLGVSSSDVARIVVSQLSGQARVELFRAKSEDHVMAALMENNQWGTLGGLSEGPLRVSRLSQERDSNTLPSQKISASRDRDVEDSPAQDRTAVTSSQPSTSPTLHSRSWGVNPDHRPNRQDSKEADTSTSTSDLLESPARTGREEADSLDETEPDLDQPPKLSAKTSTPTTYPCSCPDTVFYQHGQLLGPETRFSEFKRGGVVHDQNQFRQLVGRYVCGFLNCQGGTLFLGVDDEGRVLGLTLDGPLEDHLRRDVQFAVHLIQPAVHTDEFSVNFARVMSQGGSLNDNLRVLEVCVKPRYSPTNYFTFMGVAYLRRDGSLQTLRNHPADTSSVRDSSFTYLH